MKILRAEEQLAAGVSDNEVYDAVLAATGSEERAAEELALRIKAVQDRGERADI